VGHRIRENRTGSSVPFHSSSTKSARSLAGFVLLALELTLKHVYRALPRFGPSSHSAISGVTLGSSGIAAPVMRQRRTNAISLIVVVASFVRRPAPARTSGEILGVPPMRDQAAARERRRLDIGSAEPLHLLLPEHKPVRRGRAR
jgi:hypothetical protein